MVWGRRRAWSAGWRLRSWNSKEADSRESEDLCIYTWLSYEMASESTTQRQLSTSELADENAVLEMHKFDITSNITASSPEYPAISLGAKSHVDQSAIDQLPLLPLHQTLKRKVGSDALSVNAKLRE